jgi:hypothetical protein
MKKIILFAMLVTINACANSASKAPAAAETAVPAAVATKPVVFVPVEKVVKDLTVKSILVRVALGPVCPAGEEALANAGGNLELAYDNGLSSIDPAELTLKTWKKMNRKDCLKDCSCYAISRVYERYPEDLKAKISNKALEAKLAKMTDKNYQACMKKIKNFCDQPEVKSFQ